MPEGHTTHRLARQHGARLGGRAIAASSPQGRFTEGAALLDGARLESVSAHGKHLLYAFDRPHVLHVHLGLIGKFAAHEGPAPAPGTGVRLRLAVEGFAADLTGPMVCELLAPGEERAVIEPLGPDPLRRGAGGSRAREEFARRLRRRQVAVGAALLDQTIVAGVGNVYRAEVLFLCGIHPDRPAGSLDDAQVACLWDTLRAELSAGLRLGRIVTVVPSEVGARSRARVPDDERVYVYRRGGEPCRRCGTTVAAWTSAQRTISACPTCQPR